MNRKRTALAVAAAGTATGVVGLILLAAPAGAGEAPPVLPDVSAEALVQSVLSTDIPALSGSVEFTSDLGLPIPGLPKAGADGAAAHVYTDGDGKARLSIDQGNSEKTIVHDGSTTWIWDSADKSVRKVTGGKPDKPTEEKLAEPTTAARDFVGLVSKYSTVAVDGTARVADRPVYQLVLTPKPDERTLLREVKVAVDSATRVPLRLEVLANGQAEPALRIGFTELTVGPQDASLFSFTPPSGVTVTEEKAGEHQPTQKEKADMFAQVAPKLVGEGWDTVLVGTIPAGVQDSAKSRGGDMAGLLKQFGKEVTGPFGTGHVVSIKVGTVLVTADGRVALGAVPQQVLVDALGQK